MSWLQLSVDSEQDAAETVSELMSSLGAVSVTFSDAGDKPIYDPDINETQVWWRTKVTGLFESDADPALIQGVIMSQMEEDELGHWEIETLEDQVWERAWMDHFKPTKFGNRLWVCPSGQTPPTNDGIRITLDPGLAFGTGNHATTALCLEWLDATPIENRVVIDYGCGSGILSVAAVLLGARQVYAVDIDPQALIAARDNADKNNVGSKIICRSPDELDAIEADFLIANMLAKPLFRLADCLIDLVHPGGILVLSGILEDQIIAVRQAYSKRCQFIDEAVQDNWARLSAQRL